MSYLIFARKYRPRTFDEVLGQEPVIRTLKNAIDQKRIPQSYLFAGPRGIGKTSVARILAKALNCENGPKADFDPESPQCTEIEEGRSLDVLEIDGASNRGIEEIRNLRETVKFKPASARFKIYIIDEVHMLTPEAFNALLKTLEEPPPHVKFIFATTEGHKVPLTILSRCQRFNFKRISVDETVHKLEEIAKKEKIRCEKNVLFLIAKASEGALRDAEGLLDQLAAFGKGEIKEEDVLFVLGQAPEAVYFSLLEACRKKDAATVFETVRSLYDQGADLGYFAKGLLECFRTLLVFQSIGKADSFCEWSSDAAQEFRKRKNDFTRGELLLAVSILQNLQGQIRRALAPPRLLIETTLLKILHLDGLRSVAEESEKKEPRERSVPPAALPPTPTAVREPERPARIPSSAAVPSLPRVPGKEPAKRVSSQSGGGMTLTAAEECWPRVIEYVKNKRMSMGVFLSESEPLEVTGNLISLGLPAELQFHKETLEKEPVRKIVEEAFEVIGGEKVKVQFVVHTAAQEERVVPASEEKKMADKKLADVVTDALGIFSGAKIIRKDA
ncbi:MAG: DNA polymerase III subunit gamma/tau [Candidatus Omnitrophota bacterium]